MGGFGFSFHAAGWEQARRRLDSLPPPLRASATACGEALGRALPLVEALAAAVAPAARVHSPASAAPDGVLAHFVDGEVVDLFRRLADGWVDGVLDLRMRAPDDLEGDLSLLRRFLAIVVLAAGARGVSPAMREAVLPAAEALLRWCDEAAPVVEAFARALPT